MKNFFRNILINFLAFFLIAKITGGVSFSENYLVLFSAALFLTILNLLIKPLLNLLLMPINLLTLGAFRWVVNVIVLFMVTILVSNFKVIGFTFSGLTFAGFVIPAITFSFFWALILVSFLIEIVSGLITWIFE